MYFFLKNALYLIQTLFAQLNQGWKCKKSSSRKVRGHMLYVYIWHYTNHLMTQEIWMDSEVFRLSWSLLNASWQEGEADACGQNIHRPQVRPETDPWEPQSLYTGCLTKLSSTHWRFLKSNRTFPYKTSIVAFFDSIRKYKRAFYCWRYQENNGSGPENI